LNVISQIYQFTIHVTAYISVYTLVLMSLDRYLAVVLVTSVLVQVRYRKLVTWPWCIQFGR